MTGEKKVFAPDKKTKFRQLCEEHELSYKDICQASGIPYHRLAKIATRVYKPTREDLDKLNGVCEPIFGRTLTPADLGFETGLQLDACETAQDGDERAEREEADESPATAVTTPDPETDTITIAVEKLSSGYVLRETDGWSECFSNEDSLRNAIVEHIDRATMTNDYDLGYILDIRVKAVANPMEFYEIKVN